MIGALRFPAYGITQTLAEFRQLTRCRYLAVIDFDQIADATGWARVVLSGALRVSPYGSSTARLLFLYDYDAHRRRGGADRPLQHLDVKTRASPSPSACNRSDGHHRGTRATALTGRERSIAGKGCLSGRERSIPSKGCLFVRCHCKSGH